MKRSTSQQTTRSDCRGLVGLNARYVLCLLSKRKKSFLSLCRSRNSLAIFYLIESGNSLRSRSYKLNEAETERLSIFPRGW